VTLRVAIVGPGRAGRSIANALAAGGVPVVGLIGRRSDRVPLASADVVLVTVRDADLPDALGSLNNLQAGAVVLHASGASDPVESLERLRKAGHPVGTFHPLASLANPDAGGAALRGAWIGVEGDLEAQNAARTLASAIGASPLFISAGAKPGYHAAAVIAANFVAVLAAAAEREMGRVGVEARAAHAAVSHLMRTSIDQVMTLGPARGLAGPVSRGDVDTVRRNLAALSDDPAVRDLYVAATRIAIDLARKAGANPERLDDIGRALHP
jgi:predicted short-subunit dehydrogenase-like oxidoreductase (DUF2520 family)